MLDCSSTMGQLAHAVAEDGSEHLLTVEESAGSGLGGSVHGVAEGRTPVTLALAARYPALWHCCFIGAWPGICAYRLQSVTRLAELAQVPSQLRGHILRQRRTQSERLELPDGRQAVLRDQAPLRSRILERHLEDMSEEAWFTLLNARVFLFTQERHVRRLLAAYADEGQDVIKLKTSALLAACADKGSKSPRSTLERYPARQVHLGVVGPSFRWQPSQPTMSR